MKREELKKKWIEKLENFQESPNFYFIVDYQHRQELLSLLKDEDKKVR